LAVGSGLGEELGELVIAGVPGIGDVHVEPQDVVEALLGEPQQVVVGV